MTKTKVQDISSFNPANPNLVRNRANRSGSVRLTPRFYKLLGVAALGTAVALAANYASGNDDAPTKEGYIMIQGGDNSTTIGRELGDGTDHIKKIASEVQSQVDENGYLQPGQIVHVNLENVDHPDLLLQDYEPGDEVSR